MDHLSGSFAWVGWIFEPLPRDQWLMPESINQSINQSSIHSIRQYIGHTANQSIHPSIHSIINPLIQSHPSSQSLIHPCIHSFSHSVNQLTNPPKQSIMESHYLIYTEMLNNMLKTGMWVEIQFECHISHIIMGISRSNVEVNGASNSSVNGAVPN